MKITARAISAPLTAPGYCYEVTVDANVPKETVARQVLKNQPTRGLNPLRLRIRSYTAKRYDSWGITTQLVDRTVNTHTLKLELTPSEALTLCEALRANLIIMEDMPTDPLDQPTDEDAPHGH